MFNIYYYHLPLLETASIPFTSFHSAESVGAEVDVWRVQAVSLWGLPAGVDAALQWDNGRTYFFSRGNYWRFNDRRFSVDNGSPAFPRPTAQWWLGCPAQVPHF